MGELLYEDLFILIMPIGVLLGIIIAILIISAILVYRSISLIEDLMVGIRGDIKRLETSKEEAKSKLSRLIEDKRN